MNNLYEPTKSDLVYFAKRVINALDVHVPGWRNTTPRCPTYPDRAADIIRQFASLHREAVQAEAAADFRRALNDAYNRLEAEVGRKRESRVFAHMVECLNRPVRRDRSFYQTEKAQAAVRRVPDSGPAHGLRQHSIGSTYPVVVVGGLNQDGGTEWHIEFAGHRSRRTAYCKQAHEWAENIARHYRSFGWDSAKARMKGGWYA